MKFDVYDMGKVYKDFFSAQQNQIEILQQMRAAMEGYTNLTSFSGRGAESAKAYMSEVHISIIDTINMALMEMEIRLLTLKQDFNSTVDSDSDAVLSDTYIEGVADEINGYISKAEGHKQDIDTLAGSVTDIIILSRPSVSVYLEHMRKAEGDALDTLENVHQFEHRHASDMDNVNEMLWAINSASDYIKDFGSISSFNPETLVESDWRQRMYACQFKAYLYAIDADPDFFDTIYIDFAVQTGLTMVEALIPPGADAGLIMDALKSGMTIAVVSGLTSGIEEATVEAYRIIQLFKSGIRFMPEINSNGETVIKAVSVSGKALTRSVQVAALHTADILEDVNRATSRGLAAKIFSTGGLNANTLQGGAIKADSIAALTAAANAGDDAAGFMRAFAKQLKGAGKATWILAGVSIAIDVADAFYDERTNSFAKFDGVEFAANATVTAVSVALPILAAAGAGALKGSVIPGIGNLVGATVGLVLGCVSLIKWGEPPKSITDIASDWLEDTICDVGNWFSKVFW